MKMNTDGVAVLETTMAACRRFPGWQDELDTQDCTDVIVAADGGVSCAESGDRICEWGFQSEEMEAEWVKYWGF